jgi:hypothetical protein
LDLGLFSLVLDPIRGRWDFLARRGAAVCAWRSAGAEWVHRDVRALGGIRAHCPRRSGGRVLFVPWKARALRSAPASRCSIGNISRDHLVARSLNDKIHEILSLEGYTWGRFFGPVKVTTAVYKPTHKTIAKRRVSRILFIGNYISRGVSRLHRQRGSSPTGQEWEVTE